MMHVHPLDALADTLPFVMLDTSSRPVGCSGLAFREPRARPVTRISSPTARRSRPARAGPRPSAGPRRQSYDACMPEETEYLCTHDAHDPDSLTVHMNDMARDGWELVTVDFAIKGETGFHTFFWRRSLRGTRETRQAADM